MKLYKVVTTLLILGFTLGTAGVPALAASAAVPQAAASQQTLQLAARGTTHFNPSASVNGPDADSAAERALMTRLDYLEHDIPRGGTPAQPVRLPQVASAALAGNTASLTTSFEGLKHFDQRFANGGNQFSLEPPDQGLCVGNGFVVESVNDIMKVYSTSGASLSGVQDLNSFFGLAAQIDRSTGVIGPFVSDPKCYYDTATGRWFLTTLMIDNGTNVGATNRSFTQIAVSQTSDPTGAWFLYFLDATDDGLNGTPSHTSCPCFGDQPLIGADANGFYISTNEFPDAVAGFNGAQFYAIPKAALTAGASTFAILFGNLLLAEGQAYSVQPATSPDASQFESRMGGTEYALSALDFTGLGDTRIAVWALSNTKTLNGTPNLALTSALIQSEAYAMPPMAVQKSGSTPLRDYFGDADALATLNTNDDRMNQTVFSQGHLWAGLNTALIVGGATHAGIAYFEVKPTFAGTLSGNLTRQGYTALTGSDLLFPSIGVTSDGQAVMAMSASGSGRFPSAAYASLTGSDHAVHMAANGVGPEDGFTGYPSIAGGSGVSRWGDYSAAVASGSSIWMASEYIGSSCTLKTYRVDATCGGTRSFYANWDTRVSNVTP